MAKPSDLGDEVLQAAERSREVRAEGVTPASEMDKYRPASRREIVQREETAKRIEAMGLRMAGLSYEQVAERMGVDALEAEHLVELNFQRVRNRSADSMRDLENARLDRLQAAVWPDALKGDTNAVNAVLAISARRSRMNGLDAPRQVALSVSVRQEMEQALSDLREVVLGEVVEPELRDSTDLEADRDDDY